MIYQKYNHPSVCFWGLFNELLISDGKKFQEYDNPVAFVKELNEICRSIDSTRLTTFATCVDQKSYLGCSDLIAWNKYFDWKSSEQFAAKFFDNARSTSDGQPVGVSEYGRGGSALQHADHLYHKEYRNPSTYHPEEYQATCHEGYWSAFRLRNYLWTKTIWQFADCQSSIKNEGDTPGINDKGMMTYHRQTKKDAFYFYKANWSTTPMLHLCSKRFTNRTYPETNIKAYTNMREATLYVNGKKIGASRADSINRVEWKGVTLQQGENVILVKAKHGKTSLEDSCKWVVEN